MSFFGFGEDFWMTKFTAQDMSFTFRCLPFQLSTGRKHQHHYPGKYKCNILSQMKSAFVDMEKIFGCQTEQCLPFLRFIITV